jgi:ketosteroid isomerase-like protein
MRLFILFATISLLAACQQEQSTATGFDIAKVKAAIDSANQTYGERPKHKDLAFYEARYTKDACSMPEDTVRICGLEAIRNYFTADSSDYKVVVKAEEVFGGPACVTEVGNYEVLDGKGQLLGKGKFMVAWKEEAGTWKIHREIWNSDKR